MIDNLSASSERSLTTTVLLDTHNYHLPAFDDGFDMPASQLPPLAASSLRVNRLTTTNSRPA